jgi:hypothetical protein
MNPNTGKAKTWSFYHRETGVFHPGYSTCPPHADPSGMAPPDHVPIEGLFDHLSRRVDVQTGEVVSVEPPAPDLAARARARRDSMLLACDWTQGRDVPEATALKWRPYRQALRDITGQPGFPDDIEWPAPPAP